MAKRRLKVGDRVRVGWVDKNTEPFVQGYVGATGTITGEGDPRGS